jgi:hypothetical protein
MATARGARGRGADVEAAITRDRLVVEWDSAARRAAAKSRRELSFSPAQVGAACAPQKLNARIVGRAGARAGPAGPQGWSALIDLLRNVAAACARFFVPRAVVATESLLLRHQLTCSDARRRVFDFADWTDG